MVVQQQKGSLGAELVSGLLGVIDVGNLIERAVYIQREIEETQKSFDQIKALVYEQDGGYTKILRELVAQDFEKVKDRVTSLARSALLTQAGLLRAQLIIAASGLKATSAMAGLYSKYRGQFEGLSVLFDAAYGIPISFLLDNATRYWHRTLTPNPPKVSDATKLVHFGKMDRSTWVRLKQEEDGIPREDADKLFETIFTQLSAFDVVKLYRRGVISYGELETRLRRLGYAREDVPLVLKATEYIPSFYDLTRLADYVPLSPIYIRDVLKANGVRDEDIPRLVSYLSRRPLREETRSVLSQLVYEFSKGRLSERDLTEAYEKLGLLAEERKLYDYLAKLRYRSNLMELQLDIVEQKAKKGAYTSKEEIVAELVRLGWVEEFANLIAEKLYWQYMVK